MKQNIKIIAIVKFNEGEAFVLNRKPEFEYEKKHPVIYGKEGGFFSCYIYDRMSERWKAFAGRKFEIQLKNGEIEKCIGQWWHGGFDKIEKIEGVKLSSVTYETIENLKKCYVFTGGEIEIEYLKKLREEYKGQIFEYRDYEKIIKFDDMRMDYIKRCTKLENDKKSLIKEAKLKHKLLNK